MRKVVVEFEGSVLSSPVAQKSSFDKRVEVVIVGGVLLIKQK
jgi:hypothetical protein